MKKILLFWLLLISTNITAQPISQQLNNAWKAFIADSQMRYAIAAFSVFDLNTGKPVFERNANIGLAPASTQKIITSVAAFEMLGKDYRFKTELGYIGSINKGELKGDLCISGSGDPTLGSWRWKKNVDSNLLGEWTQAIKSKGIKSIDGNILVDTSSFSYQAIPDGWIWQDIGNYYGAGSFALNWKENQFDVLLKSGNYLNAAVEILSSKEKFINELRTAEKGSGDNAYAYLPIEGGMALLKGTIPVGESLFSISLATYNPIKNFLADFRFYLNKKGIGVLDSSFLFFSSRNISTKKPVSIYTQLSPSLDSINYFFLRKSINLYGEALVKIIAREKRGFASTDEGVEVIKKFFASKGFHKLSLNIRDGSGLSPQNKVTANALTRVLQFAKGRPWFVNFYESLPEFNNMKMKSGSIDGVKAFTGYHSAANGKNYAFTIIVNNFSGSSPELNKKIFRLLDNLK